jgi:hypothetical protein
MNVGSVPVAISTIALIVVVDPQIPLQILIYGLARSEAAFTVPCEMVRVSAGFFLTVVVRVYAEGASQPTRVQSQGGELTTTLNAISRVATPEYSERPTTSLQAVVPACESRVGLAVIV